MRELRRIATIALGMTGLRIDQAASRATFVVWVAGFALSVAAYQYVFVWGGVPAEAVRPAVIGYAVVMWALYFGGNTLVLGTSVRFGLQQRLGTEGAQRLYNAVLGLVFLHGAFAQGAVMFCWSGTIELSPAWLIRVAGLALVVIGFGIKLWATRLTSLDTYYYNDMFLDRPEGELVESGPFRWFNNPMYGVGNLQGYGSAMLALSWEGLLVAGVYHVSLYGFYFLLERPFVIRSYQT
ncbi:MAG: PEMT/PEM2 family methyltransferase [Polyangiales bacterium]